MVSIFITDLSTGEEREHDWVCGWFQRETRWSALEYIWTEGNYSCDCNRALFFANEDEPEPIDAPCSSHLFSIRVVEDNHGEVYNDMARRKENQCRVS